MSYNRPVFKPTIQKVFGLILIVAVLHFWGLERYYYWIFWWYDIILHTLGGLWVGVVTIWLGRRLEQPTGLTRLLVITLAVGVMWELYELGFGLTWTSKAGYLEDTGLDLFFDLAGALGASLVFSSPFPSPRPSDQRRARPPAPSSPPAHQ